MSILPVPLTVGLVDQTTQRDRSILDWQRVVFVLAIIVLSFPAVAVPLFPSLDSSWMIGLNEAAKRGLVFGRDVGFTYGPLGHFLFPINEGTAPTTCSLALLGLYATWWVSVALVISRLRGRSTVILFVAGTLGFGIISQRELLCTPNIILLATSGFLVVAQVSQQPGWAVPAAILTAVGLLGKFNIGIACLGSFLAYLAVGLFSSAPRAAALRGMTLITLHMAALAGLFVIVNGPLAWFYNYFRTYFWAASGYSSQMTLSVNAPHEWCVVILIALVVIALSIPLLDRATRGLYAPLLFILAVPLFLTYKSTVVRFDDAHMNAGIATLLALVSLLLASEMGKQGVTLFRLLIPALTLGSIITVFVGNQNSPEDSCASPIDGPIHLGEFVGWDRQNVTRRVAYESFRAKVTLPTSDLAYIKQASVDVYPWDISVIAANKLQWQPRYVLQSYEAFHPALDLMSAAHYEGPRAPRFILYRYQSIDNQHPCLVDPRTWIEIYRWYDLRRVIPKKKNDLLLLERRVVPRFGESTPIGSRTAEIGQDIMLPEVGNKLLLLRADLDLSLTGQFKEHLYKVEPPKFRITYDDGETVERRLVWKNIGAGSGALVSELPRNLNDVASLLSQKRLNRVRSVTFVDRGRSFCKTIEIQFSVIDFGTEDNMTSLELKDRLCAE